MIDYEFIFVHEGKMTGDRRLIDFGATTWDHLPVPVIFDGERVGEITFVERKGNDIIATIDFELPEGMVLSLDGGDSEMVYENETWIFKHISVRGAHVIPRETWAYYEEAE
jgi:hypothetical protein